MLGFMKIVKLLHLGKNVSNNNEVLSKNVRFLLP